ncbi:hypothetical protein QRX50_06075 [Amycolatopsis carbonis]|uniref:Serine hydrolase n=1 Tax=Amycolatopsis carbonis TaxID=715471 RepID=A0A9Y2IJW1_9PSEU|nr:hypothetical protein [Amycolatopsis sp. 2-15]WIX80346.1 hypothetical protein QRX50_06075 [Amycolatopsis sp. 2-15]
MRKVNILFLVGLCLGALVALVLVVVQPQRHIVTALGPTPVAAAGTETTGGQEPAPDTSDTPAPTRSSGASAKSHAPAKPGADRGKQLEKLVPDGHVSVVVYDRRTKSTVISLNPDRTYTSASLVKLMIAFRALDHGAAASTVTEMLERSDDHTASALWTQYGWTSIVDDAVSRMGLKNTRPPASAGHWGDTRITAGDITRIYQYLMDEAPERDRTVILNALHHATEYGADGIRQFFGIPDAFGPGNFAVKQGWSCCEPSDSIMLHTTGLVDDDRFLVTVLTQQPAAADYGKASAKITAVIKNLVSLLRS